MQPQGLGVFRTIGLLVALGHRSIHTVGDRRVVRIGDLNVEHDAQIIHLRCFIHKVKAVIVRSAGSHGERVVVRGFLGSVLGPFATARIRDGFESSFVGIAI